jgi:hypothetical protein
MRIEAVSYQWIFKLERIGLIIMLLSVPINFLLAFWNREWLGLGVTIGFSLALAIHLIHFWCFYNLVKCPYCSGKLNKFKNGNNVPMKQAYARLRNFHACPHCGASLQG